LHAAAPIAKLARKYLCVCATSVPSERLFSIGGKTVHGRSRLKPKSTSLFFWPKTWPFDFVLTQQ
jgi:hypothetical protein